MSPFRTKLDASLNVWKTTIKILSYSKRLVTMATENSNVNCCSHYRIFLIIKGKMHFIAKTHDNNIMNQ